MPRKKETPKKQHVFKHEAYIEGSGSVVDEKIADTLKKNYMPYAMSVIISRDRRFQAFSQKAAVYDVQEGTAQSRQRAFQVCKCCGRDHEAQSPRRSGDI